ncbi:uncharacterized protein TRIADDRAFT_62780 [Trichoplax adhaerens]|uniref:Uncharacterized protein n=1 Tax=Trichoplax adhaerens TaxID=10228 RepID=B3SEV0_TRIAD|nr:predicted protein [Trichoplax adhaerens]EDV18745.1 predicted protein [Trichoplax adhaerens]|eukprot:XP_002118769.1 predicted protein [Trichoplax adhaerens]
MTEATPRSSTIHANTDEEDRRFEEFENLSVDELKTVAKRLGINVGNSKPAILIRKIAKRNKKTPKGLSEEKFLNLIHMNQKGRLEKDEPSRNSLDNWSSRSSIWHRTKVIGGRKKLRYQGSQRTRSLMPGLPFLRKRQR